MDVLPKLLIEIRDDDAVDAIVDGRVRGFQPQPPTVDSDTGDLIEPGDARGPGEYVPFVVLVQLDAPRDIRVPIQRPTIVARCYGRTPAEAASLRWAVSNAIHHIGPRVHANGLGIYHSTNPTGGEQEADPDTGQPMQALVINAVATTVAVGVGS